MLPFKKFLFSSIGKKYVMAASGLSLVGFLVTHLAANLTLLTGNPDLINGYGHTLKTSLGPFFYPAEFGLLGAFFLHAALAAWLHFGDKKQAAGGVLDRGYNVGTLFDGQRGKGGPSKYGISSSNMIVTGIVLGVFLIVHLIQIRLDWQFSDSALMTNLNGEAVPDLYMYCHNIFSDWWNVVAYVGTFAFLGFHLRHGLWSSLQSLGAMKPEWSKGIYAIGLAVALIFAVGFMLIPIWMHFDIGGKL